MEVNWAEAFYAFLNIAQHGRDTEEGNGNSNQWKNLTATRVENFSFSSLKYILTDTMEDAWNQSARETQLIVKNHTLL